MNKYLKIIAIALAVVIVGAGISIPVIASAADNTAVEAEQDANEAVSTEETELVFGEEETTITIQADAQTKSNKAMAAALVVGISAACGAIGMALAIAKSVEGVSRQPEASGKIQTMLMLGLVFIETAIIYALIVAILIIFVL